MAGRHDSGPGGREGALGEGLRGPASQTLDIRGNASIVAADMTGLPSTISLRILRLLLPA